MHTSLRQLSAAALMAFCIASFLTLPNVSVDAATLYVSSNRAAPGDSAKVIRISLKNDIPLAGSEFIFEYDPTHIDLDSIALSPSIANQTGTGFNEFQPGKVAFLIFDLQGLPHSPDSVDAFEMWFRASPQAPIPLEIPLEITAASFVDEQLYYDSAFASNGKLTICSCPCHADPQPEIPTCDGVLNVLDIVAIVDVAFRGSGELFDSGCLVSRTDVNCDAKTDIFDVVRGVNIAFRGGDITLEFCNPCGP